jgi:hypothetical protein
LYYFPLSESRLNLGPITRFKEDEVILHNEQGVFIPWSTICNQGRELLVQSCSALTNSDGTLSPAGDRPVGCIRNGLAAGIAATKVGLPFNLTKSILGGLAGPLGCGGIIDMNKIQNSNEFQYLLHSVEQ